MPETGKCGTCCICGRETSNIHMHHTIPRSLGGEDSLQIPLDGDCHTKLHAHASAIVAKTNGKRKKAVGSYWQNAEDEERAKRWLIILVDAMLNPPSSYEKQTLLPQLRVDGKLRHALEILKRDQNLKNLDNTLMYCIHHTLESFGILENDNTNKQNSSNQNQKRNLRRLQRSGLGKASKPRGYLR